MALTTIRSRRLTVAAGAFAVWAISVSLLRYAYPVYFDGGGPMRSFFCWGQLPGLAEYNQRHLRYDARFLLPYCIAAIVITVVCFLIAPKLSYRLTHRHSVGLCTLFSLVLVFAAAAISDVVNMVWVEDVMFFGGGVPSFLKLLVVGLPVAVASELFMVFIGKGHPRVRLMRDPE